MTIMKRLADILLYVAALLLLAACTDDADVYNTPAASKGNLCVYVPVTRGDDGNSQSDIASGNPTYNATVDECQVNDLWLYAFPQDGDGTLLSQQLTAPSAANMLNENVATYQLQIQPGTYRIYVVANMNPVLDGKDITTEEALRNIVLGYMPMTAPGMPEAGSIPMIYEPTENIKVAKGSTQAATVAANLKFTCVKVRLNMIFDNSSADAPSKVFGSHGLYINNVVAENLSQQTPLVWGQKFQIGEGDKPADTFTDTFTSGKYYDYDEQRDFHADNEDKNDADMVIANGTGTDRPATTAGPWLYQTTMYLPERYVAKNADQSFLTINGIITDKTSGSQTATNNYRIDLGHTKDASSELRTLPRGTYYEIVARVKSIGNTTLDCQVNVKDWEPVTVDADFMHTTLWVSTASVEVSSLKEGYIDYDSNADNVEFGCDTKLEATGAGQLPVVIVASHDPAAKRVFFKVNPNISIADFEKAGALTGTAKVWLKANNLKKYINVKYDVKPFFNVDPVDVVIYWNPTDAAERTKVVKFATNLTGIKFPWSVDGDGHTDAAGGQSQISIKCANTTTTDGTFTITALQDPVTTTEHTFVVKPIGDGTSTYDSKAQTIRVTVKPAYGPYRIYMRAINDLAWCKESGGAIVNEAFYSEGLLDEEAYNGNNENNNWLDGWNEEQGVVWSADRSAHENYHFVYIYTQIGETQPDGTKDPNTAEWLFGGTTDYKSMSRNTVSQKEDDLYYKGTWWPGRSMKADYNNPGWYYYQIDYNAQSVANNGKGKATTEPVKTIKPGQTLLMFNNATWLNRGFQSHRFTHHNDPGITLFNYEDREGWYLYDPTSYPYYHVYDDKPTIVDVEYWVYTKYDRIQDWYVNYGVSNSTGTSKFSLYNTKNESVENQFKSELYRTVNMDKWYKTIIHLKAPLGEYEKSIHLNIVNGQNNVYDSPMLFDGENYPVTQKVTRNINGKTSVRYVIEGTYYPGTGEKYWKKGAPDI